MRVEGDGELLDRAPGREIETDDAVRAGERHEQLGIMERQCGRVRADEEGGQAGGRTGGQINDADGRVAPVAHVQVIRVGDDGVRVVPHCGYRPAALERRGVDQVHRVAQVPHDGHEPLAGSRGDSRWKKPRVRIGERYGVGRPARAAQPHQAVHPVRAPSAGPDGVSPVPSRAGQAEPRGFEWQAPHELRGDGVDPHQPVRAVAVVRDQHRSVGEGEQVERQRPHRHLPARGANPPAGREERRAVFLRAGDEARGEHGEGGDRGNAECRSNSFRPATPESTPRRDELERHEQESLEHGAKIWVLAPLQSPP